MTAPSPWSRDQVHPALVLHSQVRTSVSCLELTHSQSTCCVPDTEGLEKDEVRSKAQGTLTLVLPVQQDIRLHWKTALQQRTLLQRSRATALRET